MGRQMIIERKKGCIMTVYPGMGKTLLMMFIGLGLMMISCQSKAQDQVPKEVKTAFQQKYPGENDPDWKKDKNENYESHFKIEGKHYRADFSPNGDWIETERSIDRDDLPEKVQERIKAEYGDFEIVEIEEVEHHSKGIFYDVEFKRNGEKKDVEFKADGQVLK
ncbi:PepSY-like domain-containing protein [Flavobacteriaceae bacterium KMM 6897]|nr:PepSY-like domain-containing protein [Flavobacteriaceae bacterium KMM 6897]MEB8345787.1 PepSY-like domain-containing protein [Flavobacteriaceae bacterium KMM 6898]